MGSVSVLFRSSILRMLRLRAFRPFRCNHRILLYLSRRSTATRRSQSSSTIKVVYLSVRKSQQTLLVSGFRRHDVDELQQTSLLYVAERG
ncbi:hypothetical protein DFP72DRAFT_1175627, partial [Ephemerocybe angulata]